MQRIMTYVAGMMLVCSGQVVAAEPAVRTVQPQLRAHAHNDYLHERPLHDALGHGFCSVEADIFLVDGKLLVAHTRSELQHAKTLEILYLDPLKQRIAENGGRVHRGGPTFHLLIDIKDDGAKTYRALDRVLARYADMLTRIQDGKVTNGAVSIAISGNRDRAAILGTNPRYAGIDGRLTDLDSKDPVHVMPLISDNWRSHFTWRGDGEIPPEELEKLDDAVKRAHASGRRLRLWATPENVAVWKVLNTTGVDHINTDKLADLEAFLLNN